MNLGIIDRVFHAGLLTTCGATDGPSNVCLPLAPLPEPEVRRRPVRLVSVLALFVTLATTKKWEEPEGESLRGKGATHCISMTVLFEK